ncbi:MAG: hypothetical protein IPN90_05550 [Elusimicrobia bacterium]|nr:hypothetical protein [Elusimicrobiota bacterium]
MTVPPAGPARGGAVATPLSLDKKVSPAQVDHPASPPPVYLSARPCLNDYQFLADGGETFGFSVGYSRSWIVRLPPVPAGPWVRAYVGAKLGAMKTERKPGRPDWDRRVVPGEIFAAVAQDIPLPQSRRISLARTEEIPLASDPRQPLEGVGEARWFWTEIPLAFLSTTTPNLVALYSPSAPLKGEERSPILSGARAEGPPIAWWRDKAEGGPPHNSTEAFQFPAVSYTPAVAIKLVPARTERPAVTLRVFADPSVKGKNYICSAAVEGTDIDSAWVEMSVDGRSWTRWGRPVRGAPYVFSVSREALPRGPLQLRVAARDIWENAGFSPAVAVPLKKGDKP